MLRKEDGFTLVEVIAVFVILGVIMVIAIPSVNHLMEKSKEDYYKNLEETVIETAKMYLKDNANYRPVAANSKTFIPYSILTSNKYIKKINVYHSEEKCKGYVVVERNNGEYKYTNCMSCKPSSTTTDYSDVDRAFKDGKIYEPLCTKTVDFSENVVAE